MNNMDEFTLNDIVSYCDIDTVLILNVLHFLYIYTFKHLKRRVIFAFPFYVYV